MHKLKNAPSESTHFEFHGSGEICEKSTYKALYLNKRVVDIPPFDEKNFYELWPNWIPTPHRVLANGFDDLADKENPSQCGPTFFKMASNFLNIYHPEQNWQATIRPREVVPRGGSINLMFFLGFHHFKIINLKLNMDSAS